MEKKCNGECGDVKDLKEFHRKNDTKDGRRSICSECTSKARASRAEKYKGLVKTPGDKILCNRSGELIRKSQCIPYCNDLCLTCSSRQVNNIQASSDTLTPEEEAVERIEGVRGAGYEDMIAPYAEI